MNMSKSRDIQAKMPSPKVIYASNESKSVLARNLEECRDNDKNSQSVFLSFKCILARNCEGTEQLRKDTDARHWKTVRRSVRKICNRSSENRLQKSEKKDGKKV